MDSTDEMLPGEEIESSGDADYQVNISMVINSFFLDY